MRILSIAFIIWAICLNGVLSDYEFFANTDTIASGNMFQYGSSHIDDMKTLCDSLGNQCVGFSTNGIMKSSVENLTTTTDVGLFVKVPGAAPKPSPKIWPMPQNIQYGANTLEFQASDVTFSANSSSALLQRAFARYKKLIFSQDGSFVEMPTEFVQQPHQFSSIHQKEKGMRINHNNNNEFDTVKGKASGLSVEITIYSNNEDLNLETDESYTLSVQDNSIQMTAETVFGALHGLETLSQLIVYNYEQYAYQIHFTPLMIKDYPKFPYRGVLIDTSRHYLPVPTLQLLIDSLSYAKINVLHWHIVDAQSFPLEIKSFPLLWKGAWSVRERYTQSVVTSLVQYAKDRGVRIIPEFDGPGHAYAWGVGYPQLLPDGYLEAANCDTTCPVNPCDVPLDPSNPFTFKVLDGILSEVTGGAAGKGLFPDELIHLGGDEVQLGCWNESAQISDFMADHNMTDLNDVYKYYIFAAHAKAFANGRTPINWEEVFDFFGNELDPRVIIHVWINHQTLKDVVSSGYRGILSDGDWYLDHWPTDWTVYYSDDPLFNITDADEQKRVLGGVGCMWGERMDPSDVFHLVWPKTAAVAERLWNYEIIKQPNSFARAVPRLNNFRCTLINRGIGAAPVFSDYPTQPGSCFDQ